MFKPIGKALLLILILIQTISLRAEGARKIIRAERIMEAPRIDGVLDDPAWSLASPAGHFIQYSPYNLSPPTQHTEVRVVYDDLAIYIGARLYDTAPDSILTELGKRDQEDLNADNFSVDISPYDDGQNSFDFMVYASGIQLDVKHYNKDDDLNWNAVWKSKVKIDDKGWTVEIAIPYSALRFPKEEVQEWGINFFREERRNRELSCWSPVDKKISGIRNQAGILMGLKDLNPPLRLSLEPYISGSIEKTPESGKWLSNFAYGTDLKYGISESYTLDMTLIPDFSQVPSDDQVINLSPYETYYEEKRQFFTEGIEMFTRGNIFYSRRIGAMPIGYEKIADTYASAKILKNPEESRILNASKVSGRNRKGFGIGVFNAMTDASYAIILDTAGVEKKIRTQPFTNYNMLVLDKSIRNNSYFSLYNTNVYMGKDEYTANVSGTEFKLADKQNRYDVLGMLNVTQKYFSHGSPAFGHRYDIGIEKISGNARYSVWQTSVSDTYDPNDMGYVQKNNIFNNGAYFGYYIFDRFWKILEMVNEIEFNYNTLYAPRKFTSFNISFSNHTVFSKQLTAGIDLSVNPLETHDYFEPRVAGRMIRYPASYTGSFFLSPDYSKKFVLDFSSGLTWSAPYRHFDYYFRLGPRIRFSDKLFLAISSTYQINNNDIGYVSDSLAPPASPVIVFGKRDIQNIVNTLNLNYTFNENLNLSFRLRHYLFKAEYNEFYNLDVQGYLNKTDYAVKQRFYLQCIQY